MLLRPSERDLILRDFASALAYVDVRLAPADRDERTVAIGRIEGLPSQAVALGFGKASVEAYHVALDDIPADLLPVAVERCLKDTARTFKPSPPELRAYIAADLEERKRAKRRLLAIRDRYSKIEPEPAFEGPFDTAALLAATFAKIDEGTRKLNGVGRDVEPTAPTEPIYGLRSPLLQQMAEDLRQFNLRKVGPDLGEDAGKFDGNIYDAPPMIDVEAEPRRAFG